MTVNESGTGNAILSLTAYLIREASGLDDHDEVILSAGAEVVRKMALRALKEHDELRSIVREANPLSTTST